MNDSDERGDAVLLGCVESCERLLQVADSVTREQYVACWKARNGIGPHLRHCYEHLAALHQGLPDGTIRYDARARDAHIEEDPERFKSAMAPVVSWIRTLVAADLDQSLTIRQIPRIDAPESVSDSTLRRELLFLTSHTIHHLAIVGMLAEVQGVTLPRELGVAYSTTTHEHRQRDISPTPTD